jgi:hypothetical protein
MRLASLTLFSCTVLGSMAMPLPAQTFDVSVPPGENFDIYRRSPGTLSGIA